MKKAATEAARYTLTESSMVIIDHLQFQSGFFNNLQGKFRTLLALNNTAGGVLDFNKKTFGVLARDQYNLVRKLMHEKNHKQLIPYVSQPLYHIIKTALKKNQDLPWKLEQECIDAKIMQARMKGEVTAASRGGPAWYQITCEFLNKDNSKKYHVLERGTKDLTWKFLHFDD